MNLISSTNWAGIFRRSSTHKTSCQTINALIHKSKHTKQCSCFHLAVIPHKMRCLGFTTYCPHYQCIPQFETLSRAINNIRNIKQAHRGFPPSKFIKQFMNIRKPAAKDSKLIPIIHKITPQKHIPKWNQLHKFQKSKTPSPNKINKKQDITIRIRWWHRKIKWREKGGGN